MDNTIPTAEEYLELDRHLYEDMLEGKLSFDVGWDALQTAMIEFAKLHVQKALESAANKAEFTNSWWGGEHNSRDDDYYEDGGDRHRLTIDERTILNAYPLTNIK